MRLLIFGTGKIYQNKKRSILEEIEIVGLLDNNHEKQGTCLDGVKVYSPHVVYELDYDYIYIMAAARQEMKEQLLSLGVDEHKIISPELEYKVLKQEEASIHGGLVKENCNILVFSDSFAASGAQNVMLEGIKCLLNYHYSIAVVANKNGEIRGVLDELGVCTVLTCDYRKESALIKQLVEWADVIWVNTLWLQYMIEEIVTFGKPIFWWLHESGMVNKIELRGLLLSKEFENIRIFAVSRVVSNYLGKHINEEAEKIKQLGFGLRERIFKTNRKKDKIVFLQIGPFAFIKAQDLLLQAIESLPTEYKEISEFWLVGGGQPDAEMQELIQKNPCVKVKGRVDNAFIPEFYANSDVVICPSREESMSISVMEGFMNGLPAIVSDVTGITEYMENGREGYIYETDNLEALKQGIMNMVDHESERLRMGEEARKTFERNFTIELFEQNLLDVFEELASKQLYDLSEF